MIFSNFLGRFSRDLGIDLGTENTLIYVRGKGIVTNEPSVVAVNSRTDQILAVGLQAKNMVGKTPNFIVALRPLVNGVISDFEATEKMLKYFIDRVYKEEFTFFPRPRVVIAIPLDITEVERKAVEDAVLSAGARKVYLVEKSMAVSIGARLPFQEPIGNLVVDIGAGMTEIAVISLGGIVNYKTIPIAGNELNKNIVQYAREQFNLLLGEKNSEIIKMKIGSADELEEPLETEMRGRDLLTGMPKEIIVNDSQIREALSRSIKTIIENIKLTLEDTPPDLVADIYERGMVITGGGALLKGIDKAVGKATQISVRIAEDPLTCAVRGTGIVVENLEKLQHIIIPSTQTNGN